MRKINQQKIIVVVGPTASGKSDLAIKLAKKFNGEIISADSRQIYKGMDIGTGKVRKDEVKIYSSKYYGKEYYSDRIKHHLIDVCSPKKIFTADNFKKLGQRALIDIASRSRVPIIVGGTGFYIDILLGRKQVAEVPPNPKLRAKLKKQSTEHLHKRLQELDPVRAGAIDSKNRHRLIRALEIIAAIGKVPQLNIRTAQDRILWLGLKPKNLEKRIKTRLDKRLKQGMIKEVERLHDQGVSWKRLHDFGLEYRWISQWLIKNSKIKIKNYNSKFKSSEEYEILLRNIVKYSKRQMTWFKKNKEIIWNPRIQDLQVF